MSQSWVVRLREETEGKLERQKGGRPRHLTARERRRCVTLLTVRGLGVTSKVVAEIRNELGKNVFDVIVRSALRWEGFAAHVQQKKVMLTRRHVHARVRFACRYVDWTVHD